MHSKRGCVQCSVITHKHRYRILHVCCAFRLSSEMHLKTSNIEGFLSLQIPPISPWPCLLISLTNLLLQTACISNDVNFYLCSLCLVSSLTCPSYFFSPFSFSSRCHYSAFIISLFLLSQNIPSCWSNFNQYMSKENEFNNFGGFSKLWLKLLISSVSLNTGAVIKMQLKQVKVLEPPPLSVLFSPCCHGAPGFQYNVC